MISRGQATLTLLHLCLVVGLAVLGFVVPSLASQQVAQDSQDNHWPKPDSLIEQLDAIAEYSPSIQQWSMTTKQIAIALADVSTTQEQRSFTIEQLIKQRDQLAELNAEVWQSVSSTSSGPAEQNEALTISSEIVRMHYRLSRRIEIWQAALEIPVGDSLGDSNFPFQQAGFRRLNFDGLEPSWVEYLFLEDFKATFENPNSTNDEKRETARRILARIYSPALTATQSDFAKRVFDPEVVGFLKSQASEPVDAKDLLLRLELFEKEGSARAGYLLNQRYQDLLWSSVPSDQAAAARLDAHYRNANFRMTVSKEFMNRLLPELPTIAEPVQENIKGALVSGRSRISNQVDVELIPDPNRLNFQINTQGQVLADTMARTKQVKFWNQGMAWFNVSKPITVDRNGIDGSQPAYSVSRAQQKLVDIQSNVDNLPLVGNFVRKIAENKIREESPESNQIFRRKVASQAENRVEEILAKQIAKVENDSIKYLQQPLMALNLDPEPLQLATTEDQIIMRYRLAGRDQMAAFTSRPQDDPSSLLSFQVHQSLLNNGIARLGLNGNTFNSEQLAKHLQEMIGRKPKPKSSDEKDENKDAIFSFASHDPIQISFDENRVNITLNLDKLQISESAKPIYNFSMTASYKLLHQGMQVQMVQDDLGTRIKKTRGKRLSLGDRATISGVMKFLFEQNYDFYGLPQRFRDHEQAQNLVINQLVISDGWLGISLDDRKATTAQSDRIIDRLIPARLGSLRRSVER